MSLQKGDDPFSPHFGMNEEELYDARLAGNSNLYEMPQSSPQDRQRMDLPKSKAIDVIGDRILGARLHPGLTISENSSEVFCIRFSPDGNMLAAGCGDGTIRVFHTSNGRLAYNLQSGSSQSLPITSLRFRPAASQSKTRNVVVSTNASGEIQHWHVASGKCLNTISVDDQFYALDYRLDGSIFAVTGKNQVVTVYDEATKHERIKLQGGSGYGSSSAPGHSNRVFALKFHPDDPEAADKAGYTLWIWRQDRVPRFIISVGTPLNVLLTGGWDNTIQIWDMRVGHSVRNIFGPHISGDSLDVSGGEVLTGSWRPHDPLEIWDFASGELKETIPWSRSAGQGTQPTFLYAAQFSSVADGGRYIAAGGSGANETKIFDHIANNQLVGTITGLSRGVFTLDFSPAKEVKKLALAGGDASIRIIDIIEEKATVDLH